MNKVKKIVVQLLVLVTLILFITAGLHEVLMSEPAHPWRVETEVLSGDPYRDPTPNLGMVGRDPGQYRARRWKGEELVAEYTVTMEGWFRKVNRLAPPDQAKKNIILYGGSFIFGLGLNDNETLPSILQASLPDTNVYSFSVPGWGGQQLRWLAENGAFEEHVAHKNGGIVIYGIIKDHVKRFVNRPYIQLGVPLNSKSAYYKAVDGRIVYAGTFEEQFPFRNWVLKNGSKLSLVRDILRWTDGSLSDNEINLFCSYIKSTSEILKENHNYELVIFYYPQDYLNEGLVNCLEKSAKVVDVRAELLREMKEDEMGIDVDDPHPSYRLNKKLAEKLARELRQKVL